MPLKIIIVPLNIFRGTKISVVFNRVSKNIRGTSNKMSLKIVFLEALSKMPLYIFRGTSNKMPLYIFRDAFLKCPFIFEGTTLSIQFESNSNNIQCHIVQFTLSIKFHYIVPTISQSYVSTIGT